MAMLEVKNLKVHYGVIQAIKGISFEVNEGEVIALIGANGAGKTTTLQTITGMLKPSEGEILFEGQDIVKVPGHKIVSMGMAHVPEGRRVFAELSVYENLKLDDPAVVHPDIDGMVTAVQNGDLDGMISRMGNVFEPGIIGKYPVIQEIKDLMESNGARKAMMSGSGPTVFGIFDSKEKMEQAAVVLRESRLAKTVFATDVF